MPAIEVKNISGEACLLFEPKKPEQPEPLLGAEAPPGLRHWKV
ncbi:hypothetical protein ACQZV8_21745 [Magnetococcales bacterium HHB-1]